MSTYKKGNSTLLLGSQAPSRLNRTSHAAAENSLLLATQVASFEKSYNRGASNRLSRRHSPRSKGNASTRMRFDSVEQDPVTGAL